MQPAEPVLVDVQEGVHLDRRRQGVWGSWQGPQPLQVVQRHFESHGVPAALAQNLPQSGIGGDGGRFGSGGLGGAQAEVSQCEW